MSEKDNTTTLGEQVAPASGVEPTGSGRSQGDPAVPDPIRMAFQIRPLHLTISIAAIALLVLMVNSLVRCSSSSSSRPR